MGVTCDVHARDDRVDAGVLHALHVGVHAGGAERQAGVVEGHVEAVLPPGLLGAGGAVTRLADVVGEDRHLLGADLLAQIAVEGVQPREVDVGAVLAEQAWLRGPLGVDVPAERRHVAIAEVLAAREQWRGDRDDGEDVVLLDEGPSLRSVACGVGGVVEFGDQLDPAPEHTALLIDHVEVGLSPVEDRRVLIAKRTGDRGQPTDVDLLAADAGSLT